MVSMSKSQFHSSLVTNLSMIATLIVLLLAPALDATCQ